MAIPNQGTLLKRIDELLALLRSHEGDSATRITQAFQGTMNLVRVIYGHGTAQERQLQVGMSNAEKDKIGDWGWRLAGYVQPTVDGTLLALKGDIETGIAGDLALQGSGAVLGDILGLAKEALAAGDAATNVAAVLVAAAFEDLLRRLAEAKAGVADRPKLEDVVGRLKTAGILVGASVSTANGYLKLRNDALHADWKQIQPAVVGSCLAFVEGLLLQHFG